VDKIMTGVAGALQHRRSVRAFLDTPVSLDLIRNLIETAARAPSGGNLQPWHIDVVAGAKLDDLKRIMRQRVIDLPRGEGVQYSVYPPGLTSPYEDRRREIGELMYARIGIERSDREGRRAWFARNFQFFDAPVAFFCQVDRQMGAPQWSDLGMFLMSFMLLAEESGLATCAQECWSLYPDTIGAFLGTPDHHMLFCGMAIGHADEEHPLNRMRSPRVPFDDFVTVHS
jgi:nitroreductase